MKNKIKGLLALALAAFISLTWAAEAELVIPYTFDGKAGNTEIPFEYKVAMPEEALSTFTVTVKYTGGNHRVEILGVKLLDDETEYTAVATGTDGTKVVEEGVSYSGGNNYNNIFTFTNEAGFTANKVYTLQAMLQVNNANPSHNGNIKVSGGLIRLTPTYWASFDNSNVSSDKVWNSGGISFGAGASSGYVLVPLGNKAFDLSYDAYGQQTFLSANPTAFTLSLNAKTGTAANGILIAFGSKNSTGGLVVRRGADGNEIIVTKAKSTDAIITANAPGSSVGYTNIVLTYENETLSLYINGELAGTADVAEEELIPGMNFQLGRRYGGLVDGSKEANNVNGAIDELAAWNGTALTADQVKAFYNENYADALKNTSIALFYEFEGTDEATIGNKAWDYNSPSSGNSSAEATYHNSARTKSGDIAYKSVVLDKNVHPGMSYSWPEEFTIATYVNLSECKTDGTIVSIGKSLLLRKIDRIRMALCNNGEIQYVWAEDENLSIGYHLIVVRKTATSLSLQIDDGPAQVVVLAEGNSPEITDGLQLGVRWEGGYESYDNTDDGIGVGPHLDDFLVWNGALSDASVANLCAIYPEILTEVVSAEPDGVGPHKLSDLITNGLKTGDNVIATVTLADGATLEIDQALNFSELEIVSSGSIKVKVSDLTITQAQLNAIINTNGVSGTVSTDYEEHLEGYTVNGVTYPLIFRGTTDANWTTLSNWYTGYRRNSTDIYWIPYTGKVVPGAPNSNEWRATLFHGEFMEIAEGEDGYKTVILPNTTHYEGWQTKIGAYNGVHVVIGHANKFQSESGYLRVDDTSKITFQAYGDGNGGGDKSIHVNAENGVVFAEGTTSGIKNMNYYFDGDGSVAFATLNEAQTIAGLELDLGAADEGRKVVSRKLIGFTGGNATFTVAENAVTTTAEDVTLATVDVLQNVGQYRFEKKDDGYYVSYVAYAETDEIGAMNTWTATVDGNWNTAGNWSSGFVPDEGKNATISITADTTITIPDAGVTVDTLVVNGKGTLTIAGGKLTAGTILANTSIVAGEDTLALAPMNIAEGKTVTYTTTTTLADPDDMGTSSHALSLKEMKGAGTFVKKGAGVIGLFATAAEPAFVVEEGAFYVRETPTTAMNIAAKAGAEIRLAARNHNFANTANKITLDGGAQLTLANGANVSGTITIANAGETVAKICGSSFGDSTIAAAITGAGKVEFADGGSFGDATKFPCNFATTYTGVISGDLQVIISDTSAVTFTGANTYTGGTVIAEGVTVTVSNLTSIFGTGDITGAGTVKIAGGTYNGLSFAQYKDVNTTIEIPADNTVTGYLNDGTWTCAAKIKLNGTLNMTNGYGARNYTFTGPWSGAGAISLSHIAPADVVRITGDISDFTGNISIAGARALTFCAATTGTNQKYAGKICVHGDYAFTAKVNGTWSAPVMVENGAKIGGTGTIDNTLTFANGAIIDTSITATGDVTLNGTVTVSGEAGAIVLTCANAESLDLTKFAAPAGLKCVADGNTIKLAVAEVTVTLPTVSNAVWKDANGNTITSITLAPNSSASVKLETTGDYVFADGSTSKDVTIASGDADSEATAPADASIVAAAAKIGDKLYASFDAAFADAQADATITLLAGVAINSRLDIAQNVTIDLNGQTIAETMEDQFGAIYVKKGATLTIAATNGGEITTDGGIVIGNYGTVVVNGGTIAAGDDAEADVSIYNFYYQADWYGTTTINGGTVARIWNCGVATLAGGEVTDVDNSGAMEITEATVDNIILRDGTDAPGIEGAGTLTAPEGLTVTTMDGQKVVYADGKYTVVAIPVSNNVAKIGETEYETLQAAVNAAGTTAGVEVTLIKDTTENITIPAGFNGTIDLGGKTVTGYLAGSNVELVLQNGYIIHNTGNKPAIKITGGSLELNNIYLESHYHGIQVDGTATCIINSGTYKLTSGASGYALVYPYNANASITVNGGNFYGAEETNDVPALFMSKGLVTVNGGYFQRNLGYTVYISSGNVVITGGEFNGLRNYTGTGSGSGIVEYGGGKFTNDPTSADARERMASGYKVDENVNPGYFTVVEKPAIQLTIDLGDGVSSVAYKIGETTTTIDKDTTIDIAESGTVVSFAVVADDGYFAPTVEAVTVTETTTVTIAGVAFSAVESADAAITDANRDAVYAWAKSKDKSQSEVSAAKYIYADYLFNFTEFSTAEPTIEITEFTADPLVIKAKVTVNGETKIADLSATGLNLNGTLKYKAAPTLEALEDATPKAALDATDRFFKVVVE